MMMPLVDFAHFLVLIVFLGFSVIESSHISFSPADEAFLLFHGNQNTNFTSLFVQDGCPESRNLRATIYSADQSDSRRIFEEIPLHCAAKVRIVTERVDMQRPYVDVLAVLDESFASHVTNVCVHVQLTSATSSNELGKCILNTREDSKSSCVVRVPVPFSWFPEHTNQTSVLSVSYTISEKCDLRFHDLPQHLIEISGRLPKQKIDVLANTSDVNVSLRSTSNQSYTQNSMQSMFVNVKSRVRLNESIEIRLWIDSRLTIETVYPMSPNWRIRVSSANRPFFYTSLFCTAQKNMTSFNGNIVALLVKMTSSSDIIKDDVILHWHVLLNNNPRDNPSNNSTTPSSQLDHKVATKFSVVGDEIAAVVVVPKRAELMNTAVISGQQVTSSMRIFTVSIGARPDDVTAAAHCISADAKILKTSPTCTSVYVDGSELMGSSDVLVYAHFSRYTTSFSFRVWYPKLPLSIWMSSSTLYSIHNWKVGVWRDLPMPVTPTGGPAGLAAGPAGPPQPKRVRAARQFSCANRFQQAHVRVLASLWMEDRKTGDQLYLSSHKNILFDVTNIVHNTLHVTNRSVASIRFKDGKAIISGERIGRTRIIVKNVKRAAELASENLMVHNEEVTISGLSARPVCHVYLRILPILFSPSFFKLETSYSTTINRLYQQCSIDSSVSYSDGTWEPLINLDSSVFEMSAQSNDDRSLAVSHHFSSIHLIAIAEHRPLPSVEIAIRVASQCSPIPSMSSTPLAVTVLNVPVILNTTSQTSQIEMDAVETSTKIRDVVADQRLPTSVPMHIFLLTILVLIAVFLLLTFIRRSAAFKGYEQLVAPLLSRLSSSSGSQTRHEDTNEWVWLSQPQAPSSTLGSDYSTDKSTFKRQLDATDANRTSISYHGSEISVFIAPSQANVVVNPASNRSRHAAAAAAASASMVDSTSDHNLTRIIGKEDRWHSSTTASADPHFHTWTWKHRERLTSGSGSGGGGGGAMPIRESVA